MPRRLPCSASRCRWIRSSRCHAGPRWTCLRSGCVMRRACDCRAFARPSPVMWRPLRSYRRPPSRMKSAVAGRSTPSPQARRPRWNPRARKQPELTRRPTRRRVAEVRRASSRSGSHPIAASRMASKLPGAKRRREGCPTPSCAGASQTLTRRSSWIGRCTSSGARATFEAGSDRAAPCSCPRPSRRRRGRSSAARSRQPAAPWLASCFRACCRRSRATTSAGRWAASA
mmetsp:Transcript_7426/g.30179  ORF Transcript_7426/g.30179 Transcript_7426/m.30179 type:complete len:229 (-) Transcript_7426:107-793(-)